MGTRIVPRIANTILSVCALADAHPLAVHQELIYPSLVVIEELVFEEWACAASTGVSRSEVLTPASPAYGTASVAEFSGLGGTPVVKIKEFSLKAYASGAGAGPEFEVHIRKSGHRNADRKGSKEKRGKLGHIFVDMF
jgi:hypothetical protein